MDPSNRTLDSMMAVRDPSQLTAFAESMINQDRPAKRRAIAESDEQDLELDGEADGMLEVEGGVVWPVPRGEVKVRDIPGSTCDFTSILVLRRLARKRGNLGELAFSDVAIS